MGGSGQGEAEWGGVGLVWVGRSRDCGVGWDKGLG